MMETSAGDGGKESRGKKDLCRDHEEQVQLEYGAPG